MLPRVFLEQDDLTGQRLVDLYCKVHYKVWTGPASYCTMHYATLPKMMSTAWTDVVTPRRRRTSTRLQRTVGRAMPSSWAVSLYEPVRA